MNKAVDIISEASTKLENELTNIDNTFYERLNATLANLDMCIAGFMKNKK